MRTLKDFAVSSLNTANIAFKSDMGDEITINHVAYFLQQAAELYIKDYLECNGIRYPKTHDILELLELSEDIPGKQKLLPIADTLTKWESRTRYVKNYLASRNQVESIYYILDEIINGKTSGAEDWFNNLTDEQLDKFKAMNVVVYEKCVNGDFEDMEILLDFYKERV